MRRMNADSCSRVVVLFTCAFLTMSSSSSDAQPATLSYTQVEWPTPPTSAAGVPGVWNFIQAASVAVTPRGTILVLHRGAHPIIEFESTGTFVRACGAHSVRVDPQGNIWVVDAPGHVLYKLNADGKEVMRLGTKGVPGTDASHFNLPTDVAFGPGGDIYITDGYGSARVVKYSRDGKF